MKYKVGDKVRIKNIDWYNENKDEDSRVPCGHIDFCKGMTKYCGEVLTIMTIGNQDIGSKQKYFMHETDYAWGFTDEMIECKVEDENNHITETVVDTVRESNDRYRIVIDPRFDIEVDEGEYYAVRRKKEYPKTYEECAMLLGLGVLNELKHYNLNILYKKDLIVSFQKLFICRDAYWKLYGEEKGLGKPWEPDWDAKDNHFYTIYTFNGKIECSATAHRNAVLIFPTAEMRDEFYENFKEEIKICKELL